VLERGIVERSDRRTWRWGHQRLRWGEATARGGSGGRIDGFGRAWEGQDW
jgi:hypothetical protein